MTSVYKTAFTRIEVYDDKKKLLYSNSNLTLDNDRPEIEGAVKDKRTYITRWVEGRHYIFIADLIAGKTPVCFIRDITVVNDQIRKQNLLFIRVGISGLVFLAIITLFFSKFITNPIRKLTNAVDTIISGNYQGKLELKTSDEIGVLSQQFNIMVSEIEKRISQLEDLGERKQMFVNNLIHELRTPLTSIIGYAELLKSIDYNEEIYKKGLQNIHAEGKRILESSNKLMDMILLNSQAINKRFENIKPLMEEVSYSIKLKLKEKGIRLMIEASDSEILIDGDLIKNALVNLVDNAIRASSPGSTITVGTAEKDMHKIIYVKDEGKGISREDLEKITEPFFRVDKSRSRNEGGAGLGLYICNEIAKAHNAILEFESEPGKGTIVRMVFRKKEELYQKEI